jgi:TRAP-type C4-dicarboxylate transport system substrate-binding protein
MKSKFSLMFLALALCAGMAFHVVSSHAAEKKPVIWKFQIAFPGSLWEGEINKLANMVEANTKGRVIFKTFSAGTILKPAQILNGIAQRVVEAGGVADVYFAGKIPEIILIQGVPFLYDNVDQIIENIYEYKGGEIYKIIKDVFDKKGNVIYLGLGQTSSNGLFGNFPVTSLADIKGKKIRSTGLGSALVKYLGGSPVRLPGSEHYTAFQRGTIDGTIYPFRAIKDYKLIEVVKYMVFPPFFPGGEFGILANKDAYNELTSGDRKIVSDTCLDWAKNVFTNDMKMVDKKSLDWIEKSGGIKQNLSEEDVSKLKKAVVEKILPPYINKTPECKRIWALMEGYAKEKGLLK